MRTIEHNGGFDSFLLSTPNRDLPADAQVLKRRLVRCQAKRAAAAAPAA
jgi:large subunit ribosomal protein L28